MTSESLTAIDYNTALFGSSDARAIATPVLIQQMLDSGQGISDLVFSPGRPPQVERFGELTPVPIEQLPSMRPADTAGLARDPRHPGRAPPVGRDARLLDQLRAQRQAVFRKRRRMECLWIARLVHALRGGTARGYGFHAGHVRAA